jgi:two-component system LytT family response regulator
MATQMSAYASLDSKHTGIRVALCEPDPAIRAQVRAAIDNDPLLILAAESQNWDECETCVDSVVPELLIVRSELIPSDWSSRSSEHFQPVVVPLCTTLTFPGPERNDLHVPADPQTIKATLDRAVRDIYDRKAKQLLFLVDRYVAGSQSLAVYKTFIQAECDGHPIDLHTEGIVSIVAARKHVSVHSTTGRFLLREPIHRVAGDLDPAMFVRIHRSIIVNVRHINRAMPIGGKPFEVVLNDGSRFRVGPNYRDALAKALGLREQN